MGRFSDFFAQGPENPYWDDYISLFEEEEEEEEEELLGAPPVPDIGTASRDPAAGISLAGDVGGGPPATPSTSLVTESTQSLAEQTGFAKDQPFRKGLVDPIRTGLQDINVAVGGGVEYIGEKLEQPWMQKAGRHVAEEGLRGIKDIDLKPYDNFVGQMVQGMVRSAPLMGVTAGMSLPATGAVMASVTAAEATKMGARLVGNIATKYPQMAAGTVSMLSNVATNMFSETGSYYSQALADGKPQEQAEKEADDIFAWNAATFFTSLAESKFHMKLSTRGAVAAVTESTEEVYQHIGELLISDTATFDEIASSGADPRNWESIGTGSSGRSWELFKGMGLAGSIGAVMGGGVATATGRAQTVEELTRAKVEPDENLRQTPIGGKERKELINRINSKGLTPSLFLRENFPESSLERMSQQDYENALGILEAVDAETDTGTDTGSGTPGGLPMAPGSQWDEGDNRPRFTVTGRESKRLDLTYPEDSPPSLAEQELLTKQAFRYKNKKRGWYAPATPERLDLVALLTGEDISDLSMQMEATGTAAEGGIAPVKEMQKRFVERQAEVTGESVEDIAGRKPRWESGPLKIEEGEPADVLLQKALENPAEFRWVEQKDHRWEGVFKIEDADPSEHRYYQVEVNSSSMKDSAWDFSFALNRIGEQLGIPDHAMGVTGRGDAFKVFATVASMFDDFVAQKDPDSMHFETSDTSKGRKRLYHRFVRLAAEKYDYNYDSKDTWAGGGHFEIQKKDPYREAEKAAREARRAAPPASNRAERLATAIREREYWEGRRDEGDEGPDASAALDDAITYEARMHQDALDFEQGQGIYRPGTEFAAQDLEEIRQDIPEFEPVPAELLDEGPRDLIPTRQENSRIAAAAGQEGARLQAEIELVQKRRRRRQEEVNEDISRGEYRAELILGREAAIEGRATDNAEFIEELSRLQEQHSLAMRERNRQLQSFDTENLDYGRPPEDLLEELQDLDSQEVVEQKKRVREQFIELERARRAAGGRGVSQPAPANLFSVAEEGHWANLGSRIPAREREEIHVTLTREHRRVQELLEPTFEPAEFGPGPQEAAAAGERLAQRRAERQDRRTQAEAEISDRVSRARLQAGEAGRSLEEVGADLDQGARETRRAERARNQLYNRFVEDTPAGESTVAPTLAGYERAWATAAREGAPLEDAERASMIAAANASGMMPGRFYLNLLEGGTLGEQHDAAERGEDPDVLYQIPYELTNDQDIKKLHGLAEDDYRETDIHKKKIATGTTRGNAIKGISRLDEIEEEEPNPLESETAWHRFITKVKGTPQSTLFPIRAGRIYKDPDEALQPRREMDSNQKNMADRGLSAGDAVRQSYTDGRAREEDTARFFLWSILSRAQEVYPHESGAMVGILGGVDRFINEAKEKKGDVGFVRFDTLPEEVRAPGAEPWTDSIWTAKEKARDKGTREPNPMVWPEYRRWVQAVLKDTPGSSTISNMNDFGETLLRKMYTPLKRGPHKDRSSMELMHEWLGSDMSGPEIRREFHKINDKFGIDNKILSFTLLVTGRKDVFVIDRVQARNLFGGRERFKAGEVSTQEIYDGYEVSRAKYYTSKKKVEEGKLRRAQPFGNIRPLAVEGKPGADDKAKSGLVAELDGLWGLALQEGIEKNLEKSLQKAYIKGAKEGLYDAPVDPKEVLGRYHWESWVWDSKQQVGHGSIEGIARMAADPKLSAAEAFEGVGVRQGRFQKKLYSSIFANIGGKYKYGLEDSKGDWWTVDLKGYREYQNVMHATAKKGREVVGPGGRAHINPIFPPGFLVTKQERDWLKDGTANTEERDKLISVLGIRSEDAESAVFNKIAYGADGARDQHRDKTGRRDPGTTGADARSGRTDIRDSPPGIEGQEGPEVLEQRPAQEAAALSKLWPLGSSQIEQDFDPRRTSINKTRMAGAFKKLIKENAFKEGTLNLDIGGGKFDNVAENLIEVGVENLVYDPFNRPTEHNGGVVDRVANGGADTVTINNVLNVIKEDENILNVLRQAENALKPGGRAFISVYAGAGSGTGRAAEGSWQRNQKLSEYLPLIKSVFPDVTLKNGVIRATKQAGAQEVGAPEATLLQERELLPQDPQGRIEFYANQPPIARLFERGDPSTLAHETVHWWRRELTPEQSKPFEDFLGVKPGEKWSVDQEERFAWAAQGVLMGDVKTTDQLPTGVRGALEDFKIWLQNIYRQLKGRQDFQFNRETQALFEDLIGGAESTAQIQAGFQEGVGPPITGTPAEVTAGQALRQARQQITMAQTEDDIESVVESYTDLVADGRAPEPTLQSLLSLAEKRQDQMTVGAPQTAPKPIGAPQVSVPPDAEEPAGEDAGGLEAAVTQAFRPDPPEGAKERQLPQSLEREGLVGGDNIYYRPISNIETENAAREWIRKDGVDAVALALEDEEKPSAKHTAAAVGVIATYQHEADQLRTQGEEVAADARLSRAISLAGKTAQRLTEMGQAVQAASMIARMSPEGVTLWAQQRINKINEATPPKAEKPLVELQPAEATQLRRLAEKTQEWEEIGGRAREMTDIMGQIEEGAELSGDQVEALRGYAEQIRQLTGFPEPETTEKAAQPRQAPALSTKILTDRLSRAEEAAKERLRARGIVIGAGIPTDLIGDYAIIGAARLAKRGIKFAEWSTQMVTEFGETITPHLSIIYGRSKEHLTRERKKARETAKQAQKVEELLAKVDAGQVPEDIDMEVLGRTVNSLRQLSGDEQVEAAQEVQQVLNMLEPVGAGRKISTTQVIAQLLNPKTILTRNPLGNELFYRVERLRRYIDTPIDIARSKITGGPRHVTFKKGGQGGYWKGLMKGSRLGWKGIAPGALSTGWDLDVVRGPTFRGKKNPLTYAEKLMGATLRGFDFAAYNREYLQTLGELGEVEAINKGLKGKARKIFVENFIASADERAVEIADQRGRYITFQQDSMLAKGAQQLKRALNFGKNWGLGDQVLKYPKTPSNLFNAGVDYTPISFAKSAALAAGPWLEGKRGKAFFKTPLEVNPREATAALSRALMSTGIGYGLYALHLVENDVLTGEYEEDKDKRYLEREQVGTGPYRVNLSAIYRGIRSFWKESEIKPRKGDTLYSYNWAMPVALGLGIVAEIEKAGLEGAGAADTATQILKGAGAGLSQFDDLPMLRGLKDLFKGYDGPGESGPAKNILKVLEGIPASFAPTFGNQIRQLTDNTYPEYQDPEPWQKVINRAIARLPFLNEVAEVFGEKGLPRKYNTLGSKMKKTFASGNNNWFNVFLNPGFVSEYNPDLMTQTLLGLEKATGEKGQYPRVAKDKIKISKTMLGDEFGEGAFKEGITFDLEGEDKSHMQRLMGYHTDKLFGKLMDSGDLKNLTPDQQIRKFVKALTGATNEAKLWFVRNRARKYLEE